MCKKCRFCGAELKNVFADLGLQPLSNEYISHDNTSGGQRFFPLVVNTCEKCFFTQAEVYEIPENIFSDYQYYSSFSESWLKHAKDYCDMIIKRCKLDSDSLVCEVACNDGYLLKNFVEKGIPNYGVEPAKTVANAAKRKGIEVVEEFFNEESAKKLVKQNRQVDLLIGNNVLAHVPDINSFIKGIYTILKPTGVATFEFPHLLNLINRSEFDTIYHEHYSYLSIIFLNRAFEKHGLIITDIEKLPTHGGSLRVYLMRTENGTTPTSSVSKILEEEADFGMGDILTYKNFSEKIQQIKRDSWKHIIEIKNSNKKIAAYGAAAKGNTFLNYCGMGRDVIDYVVDANPHKQGLLLPGTWIPIVDKQYLYDNKPDYLIILPWNLKNEIISEILPSLAGVKYITFIPEYEVIER